MSLKTANYLLAALSVFSFTACSGDEPVISDEPVSEPDAIVRYTIDEAKALGIPYLGEEDYLAPILNADTVIYMSAKGDKTEITLQNMGAVSYVDRNGSKRYWVKKRYVSADENYWIFCPYSFEAPYIKMTHSDPYKITIETEYTYGFEMEYEIVLMRSYCPYKVLKEGFALSTIKVHLNKN